MGPILNDYEYIESAFYELSKNMREMIIRKLCYLSKRKWLFKGWVTYPNYKDIVFELKYEDENTDEKYCIKGCSVIGNKLSIQEAVFEFEILDRGTGKYISFKIPIDNSEELTNMENVINQLLDDNRSYKYFCEDYKRYVRQDPFEYIKSLLVNHLIDFDENICDEGFGPTYYYTGEYGEDVFEIVVDDSDNGDEKENDVIFDYIRINVSERFLFSFYEPYSKAIRSLLPLIKQIAIPVNDFLVRTSTRYCINKNHNIQRIKALVCIDDGNSIKEVFADAMFCVECNQYFISELEYEKLCKQGRICSRVITLAEYIKIQEYGYNSWAEKSLLRSYGYTVNAQDDLSDNERHRILAFVIENDIMEVDKIVNFIEWLINKNSGVKYINARKKWDRDIEYVRNYKPVNGIVRVKNIYRKEFIKKL